MKQLPNLAGADWLNSPALKSVFSLLGSCDEVRVVGGAVRNGLLGEAVGDIDLATVHSADEIMARAGRAGIKAVATGGEHGTVSLIVTESGKKCVYEVTPLRIDVETDGRHAIVAPTQNWALDAQRRDFYINALYCDAAGRIYDFVDAYADVRARRVRFIGSANQRIEEDFLRILRFFRFSAAYAKGALDGRGLAACIAQKDGLKRLSAERVKHEMFKLLAAPYANEVVAPMVANRILAACLPGRIRPEYLGNLVEIERELHLDATALLRLAALAGVDGGVMKLWARHLKLSNKERACLAAWEGHVSAFSSNLEENSQKVLLYKLGVETFTHCAVLAWCLDTGKADMPAWKKLISLARRWPVPVFALSGRDVLALGARPGPEIGQILSRLEREWINAGFDGDASHLKERLKTMLD